MTKLTWFLLVAAFATAGLAQEPKKVTKSEALSAAVAKPQPDYPLPAKQLRLQGTVDLEALVDEAGAVESVTIVAGNPVLTRAATDALKKWKFTPFTAGGKATKAVAPVAFTFVL